MALRTEPVDWPTIETALHQYVVDASGLAPQNVIFAEQGGKRPADPWISLNLNNVTEAGIDWTDWGNNTFTFADLTIAGVSGSLVNIPGHGLETGDGPVRIQSTGTPPGGTAVGTNYWMIVVDADHVKFAKNYLNSVYPGDNSTPIAITLSSAGTGVNKIVATSKTERKNQGMIAYTRGTWLVNMSISCFSGAAVGYFDPSAILAKVMLRARSGKVIDQLNSVGIGINDFSPVRSISKLVSMTVFEPRAQMDMKFYLAAQVEDYTTYIARVRLEDATSGATETIERPDA